MEMYDYVYKICNEAKWNLTRGAAKYSIGK